MITDFGPANRPSRLSPKASVFERAAFGGGAVRPAGALARRLWTRGGEAFGLREPDRWAGVGRHACLALRALRASPDARFTLSFSQPGRALADFDALAEAFAEHRLHGRRFGALAAWEALGGGLGVLCWIDDSENIAYGGNVNWPMDAFKAAGRASLMSQSARGPERLIAAHARAWEFARERGSSEALSEVLGSARACLGLAAHLDRARLEALVIEDLRDARTSAAFMEMVDAWILGSELGAALPGGLPAAPPRRL